MPWPKAAEFVLLWQVLVLTQIEASIDSDVLAHWIASMNQPGPDAPVPSPRSAARCGWRAMLQMLASCARPVQQTRRSSLAPDRLSAKIEQPSHKWAADRRRRHKQADESHDKDGPRR
jgi:hypothetical protein